MTPSCALFRRFPRLAAELPWLPLVDRPTRVEPLDIPAPAGGELWVKRDDLSGELYGGNKVRKLEFLLADARAAGAGRLVTVGATGSHHALATAAYGRREGWPVSLVLFPQPPSAHAAEVAATHRRLGADVVLCDSLATAPLQVWRELRRRRRERPYFVPGGGSSRLGTLGYVDAALELAEQIERDELPPPDEVFAAAGTLGTVAGIALGLELAGLRARVVGVRIVPRAMANRVRLWRLLRGTARVLAAHGVAAPPVRRVLRRVELRAGWIGRGYGHPTEAGDRAADRFRQAGLRLDPAYTAKAAAALVAAAEATPAVRLFWHTLSARLPGAPTPPQP